LINFAINKIYQKKKTKQPLLNNGRQGVAPRLLTTGKRGESFIRRPRNTKSIYLAVKIDKIDL